MATKGLRSQARGQGLPLISSSSSLTGRVEMMEPQGTTDRPLILETTVPGVLRLVVSIAPFCRKLRLRVA